MGKEKKCTLYKKYTSSWIIHGVAVKVAESHIVAVF